MKVLWTFIALLGIGLSALAETGSHSLYGGKGRSVQQPGSKSLSNAVNACLTGRPAVSTPVTSSQPSSSFPSSLGTYSLVPREPDADVEGCLKLVPAASSDKCIQVIENCRAETIDGGQTKISPISVAGSTPCNSKREFLMQACSFGFTPDRFQSADLKCSPFSK